MNAKWIKVTRAARCPVCLHGDWCALGERWINCMRIASERTCSNGGWLHPLNGHVVRPPAKPEPILPTIDAAKLIREWLSETRPSDYARLAGLLGVSVASLRALGCAYAAPHRAWGFPMVNGTGNVVGVRLRAETGAKWSVRGGHEGIFLPNMPAKPTATIAEGPTDAAALLDLGRFGIGRPSATGGIAVLSATCARLRIRRAEIIADNDEDKVRPDGQRWNPGLDGAQRLADEIGVPCCVVVLPCKDCREALQLGMTAQLLDSLIGGLVWHQPNKNRGSLSQNGANHFTHVSP